MLNRIKYLILVIVLLITLILTLSIYLEYKIHERIHEQTTSTLQSSVLDTYKMTLKDTIDISIKYIDNNYLQLKNIYKINLEDEVKNVRKDLKDSSFEDMKIYFLNYNKKNKFVFSVNNPNKEYLVSKRVFINEKEVFVFIPDKFIKNRLVSELKKVFYNVDDTSTNYIWINEIRNYKGGDNYAVRLIHPNLKDTEGSLLSTNIKDIEGNSPYLDELEGIKSNGEVYFKYFFKELSSNKITEKLSYAKLYKELDWIVATGTPLHKLESIVYNKKIFIEKEFAKHFKKVIVLGVFTVVLFILLLWYLYTKILKYMKENIFLEKKLVNNKLNKKYHKELEKKEERYRYLMEATQDGIWDWNLLTNEVYFSPQFKEMMGFSDDELENKFENWYSRIHPDDKKQIDLDIQSNLEKETEFYFNVHRIKCKDGSWIWIEDKGKTFFLKDGTPHRMIGSHRNVTKEKKLQKRLHVKEEQYRKLFYNNGSIILLIDPKTLNILNSNKAAEKFYGYTHDEFMKLKITDINPNKKSNIKNIVKNALPNKTTEFQTQHILKNGKDVDVKIFTTSTIYDNKVVLYAIINDISEEINAKSNLSNTVKELEKMKENLDFAQKVSHIGSWEYNLEDQRLYWSKEVFNILELDEKTFTPTYDKLAEFIHPDDLSRVNNAFQSSIENKTQYVVSHRLVLKNKKIKYVEEFGENFYDEDGNFVKSIGTVYDVTKNTLMETNWKSFFSLSLNLLIIVDFSSSIIKINPACSEILGYDSDEIIGTCFLDLIHPLDIEKTINEFDKLKDGQKTFNFENRYKHKNGSYVSLAWSAVAVPESNIVYGIAQNITELKNKNYLLSQQSKQAAMGEMLGNIAHQWRQPLSLISTVATGIKIKKEFGELSDEEFSSSMDNINNTTQFLSDTIDDFRNFFNQNKEKTKFKITTLFDKTLNLISAQFTNHDIKIIRDIDDFEVEALENEFLQVLINVLNNSRDALVDRRDNDKFIFISAKKEKDEIRISIKDNAFGIDEDIMEKIFEPYFTTKHKGQGTGIGLYMSEEIITKHLDGAVEVKNSTYDYEGKTFTGAEFIIILPH